MKRQPSVRIIGGKWQRRKVSFAASKEIRPTGDIIRETLFNWLRHDITGARCLDLFSGTGILGIEALSRGASSITFIEQNKVTAAQLEHNLSLLGADHFVLQVSEAITYLKTTEHVYDIIFLDPPFGGNHLIQALETIIERKLSRGFIYIETGSLSSFNLLPDNCQIYRQKKAGLVNYGLITTA